MIPLVPAETQANNTNNCHIHVVTPTPDESDDSLNNPLGSVSNDGSCVDPKSLTLNMTIDVLKEISRRRAANSHSIAARVIAETTGFPSSRNSKRNNGLSSRVPDAVTGASKLNDTAPAPSISLMETSDTAAASAAALLSMETLKDMSTRRARQCKEIAARILAQGRREKHSLENNRFPCPAKKMGPAHNRDTAFFSIPLQSPHGMPLICSHAMCCKGRVKFVYCYYCNQPVSRMKFDERHAHPEQLLMALSDTTAMTTLKEEDATGDSTSSETQKSTSSDDCEVDPVHESKVNNGMP